LNFRISVRAVKFQTLSLLILILLPVAAAAYTEHSGTISSSETWEAGTHYVTAGITVADNQMLTIQPGAVVKFAPNTQLHVLGTLSATGSGWGPYSQIIFSASDDNEYGETIEGSDGIPAPGDWQGVFLNGASSQDGVGEFDYCLFRYGGKSGGTAIANVAFSYSNSGYMHNCISEYSQQHGAASDFCSPQVTGSTFRNNALSGFYASRNDAPPTFTDNTFTDNGQYALDLNLTAISPSISGNSGSGNLIDGLAYRGTIAVDQTWATPGFPIVLIDSVNVNTGVRLTVSAGTVIKFSADRQLQVLGTLDVNGSSGNQVVFTSLKDDEYGGDTNGDGSATDPAPGDWQGVFLNGASSQDGVGEFDYCLFRYGGYANSLYDANVYFNSSDSGYMAHCISEHSGQHGVRIINCSPHITNSTLSNNTLFGLHVSSGLPRIINSIIFNSLWLIDW
jgi:hypothetical protein